MLDVAVGVFVAIVFGAFAAVFIGETALMLWEFKLGKQASTIASFASQQFVFFPTAGVLMLICFAPMTHNQIMHRLRQGARGAITVFLFLALIFAGGWGLGVALDGTAKPADKGRIVWEISPAAKSSIAGCTVDRVFKAHDDYAANLRTGKTRASVAPDNAATENAIDKTDQTFCAATGAMESIAACTIAQDDLRACAKDLWSNKPSKVSQVHSYALKADAIFLLGMLILGLRLAGRAIADQAAPAGAPERLLLCGALLLALWPLLNTTYVASSAAIYGDDSTYRRMSPLFNVAYVAWAISVIGYLQGRFNTASEGVWRIVTVAGTALGALQFDVIIKLFRQYLGPGADMLEMVSFVLLYMTLCYQIAGLMLGATSEQKRAKAEQAEQPS
jgi:hypothetical protein